MDTTARMPPFGIATAVALLLGITACLCLPAPLPGLASAAPLVAGIVLWGGCGWRRALGAGVLGFGLCGLQVAYALSLQLPRAMERQDAGVTGRIAGLPAHEARRTRFLLRVDDDVA